VVVDTILISKVVTMAGYPLNGRLEFHGTVPERIVVNGVLITAGGKTVEIPTGVLKQGVNKLLFMCTRHRGFSFYTDVLLQYIPLPERGK